MCLAIPGRVESIDERSPLERIGQVRFGAIFQTANLAFTPEANVGDYVLVHVGVAIAVVDEREANLVFEYLRQMEELGARSP